MWSHWQTWVVIGYVSGSIPFALLLGLANGVDIRKHGSGNVGATNCGRLLGRRWGAACLILDVLKGLIPVATAGAMMGWTTRELDSEGAWLWLAVVAAAVLGHIFPVWLKFRGGKGVATGLGVLLGVWPILTLAGVGVAITWGVTYKLSRYVSLASIAAAVSLPILVLGIGYAFDRRVQDQLPFLIVTGGMAGLVVWRHRSNIARIAAGTEPRVGDEPHTERDDDAPMPTDAAQGGHDETAGS